MQPGQPDMAMIMQQAQKMQEQLLAAQQELAETEGVRTSGGDLVTATMTGAGELVGLVIKPEAVDPEDTETLADLVIAAFRDAATKTQAAQIRRNAVTGDLVSFSMVRIGTVASVPTTPKKISSGLRPMRSERPP